MHKNQIVKLINLVIEYGVTEGGPVVGCKCVCCKMVRLAHKLKKLEEVEK